MTRDARYLFIASMDIDPAKEALFNEVYDTEHIPALLKVPGVLSARRYRRVPLTLMIGGKRQVVEAPNEPQYSAVYDIETPDVLLGDAWARAVEAGRWPDEVRPYTTNRRHVLQELLG